MRKSGTLSKPIAGDSDGLLPVLEIFDLPAPYQPFNPVFLGQLSAMISPIRAPAKSQLPP